ncbi:F-box only protein 9 isoform X3 [Strongylocentrotus purpuratus]|uniref:F-box only protein 9 n=1 Tax=Strongylocentrotus purpuratus TaxID=7668 RepID=A0A7M7N3X8_STRPU|nr:F-box only protein 9 isoform X3 [Strongylocentrotus purpuratus]
MANENEIIPVLNDDRDDSDMEEMFELLADEDKGNPEEPNLAQQLTNFRQEWHQELGKAPIGPGDSRGSPALRGSPAPGSEKNVNAAKGQEQRNDAGTAPVKSSGDARSNSASPSPELEDETDVEISSLLTESIEEKAKYLFMQGVKHERNGRMYEAVMFYKQSMQLVPDVESRVQESEGNSRSGSNQASDDEDNNNDVAEDMTDDGGDDIEALAIKLQLMTTNDLRTSCSTKTPQTATHVSALPVEILLCIFRWVVTSNLDLRSLEQLSKVSRGFYVCCRDSEIWRKACVRMWGKMSYLMKEYVSWRDMYIHRAHPHFNGIYISRVTYIRQGEPSMDPFYKPWHVVEYHRFLRFFQDGTIMMASSSEDPQSIVSKMHKNYNLPGRMIGQFCIDGDILTAVLKKDKVQKELDTGRRYMRHRNAKENLPDSEQTFELEVAVTSFGRKPNMKLEWKRYACHTRYRSTGNENTTEFDMSRQFCPYYFSRVKSYTTTAETPL